MYLSVSLTVDDKLIRGVVRTPDGEGPFPTVVFYHGFTVDKVGLMRLHELFARQCVENGFACVRFDFYGCGESDGDFEEMRLSDEIKQAEAIYRWTCEQRFSDAARVFPVGHSMGGLITCIIAGRVQPKAAVMWAPAPMVYYDASARANAVPSCYESSYDIGGLSLSSEFLLDARRLKVLEESKGFKGRLFILHGDMDEKAPVASVGFYEDMYGRDQLTIQLVRGANHQFSSLTWKQEVYDASIAFLKNS